MTKPGDLPISKKTIHELAKEHPDKNYRELEKYRDADRHEEAEKIPLTESQKSQEELEPIRKGVCITAALKKDRSYPDLTEVLATENDKLKKEIKNLKWIKDHDYIFLIDENKKLHAEIKKLKEGTVDRARKAGL
jgi:predicted patatin/cPLA2 family phospholipase